MQPQGTLSPLLLSVSLLLAWVQAHQQSHNDWIINFARGLASEANHFLQESEARTIVLESSRIDTRQRPQINDEAHPSPHFAHMTWTQRKNDEANSTFLLHLSSALHSTSPLSGTLEQRFDVSLIHYLPHNTFLIFTTHSAASEIQSLPGVLWIGYLQPAEKLSQTLTSYSNTTPKPFFGVPALGLPLLELVVTLPTVLPHRTESACKKIVERLTRMLAADAAALDGGAVLRVARHDRIIIRLKSDNDLQRAARVIALDHSVMFVERRLRHQFLNRWARGVVQAGLNTTADYQLKDELISWTHHLQGQGQVLGLGDSGVDKNSCFFKSRTDAPLHATPLHAKGEHPYLFRPESLHSVDYAVETSDKIVSYYAFVDHTDASGHGTHVAGTLVGNPKLAQGSRGTLPTFAGMAPEARLAFVDVGDASGAVTLPDDLGEGYLAHTFHAGARIHVNSWGANAPLYTNEARDMDEFMYENQNFVVVNAAGNSGACRATASVVSPATSKSSVTVGATLNNAMSYAKTELVPPGFDSPNSIHLNERSLASFSSNGPTADGRIKPDVVAPGFFVFSANTGAGDNSCSGDLGAIVTPNAGTSMAAPVIAGTMALARQFFVEGLYPKGHRDRLNAFEPSGALLKAVVIHGAVKLNGSRLLSDVGLGVESEQCPEEKFVSLDSSPLRPDIEQGWGRTRLDQVLITNDVTNSMHILGRNNKSQSTFGDPVLQDGGKHVYTFCARAGIELKATLVYTDAPATLGSGIQLVNDLDLLVQTGNEDDGDVVEYRGNGGTSSDRLNPVERIVVPASALTHESGTTIRVAVLGTAIKVGGDQSYSAILTGAVRTGECRSFTETTLEMLTELENDLQITGFRLVVGKTDLTRSHPKWHSSENAAFQTIVTATSTSVLLFLLAVLAARF